MVSGLTGLQDEVRGMGAGLWKMRGRRPRVALISSRDILKATENHGRFLSKRVT